MRTILALFLILALAPACTTVTIRDRGTGKVSSDPTYDSSKAFFFWGLVGDPTVNVTSICGGKGPVQMQTQRTFLDGFLAVLTLGIYYPRTAKVWCTVDGGES